MTSQEDNGTVRIRGAGIADVTVVVPLFNHEEWIGACLSSIRADSPDHRIVVVNDGSTDASAAVVERFMECNRAMDVRLLHRENGGLCAALNTGLASVETPFLRFLDADDEFVPGGTSRLLSVLAGASPGVAAVYGDHVDMGPDGRVWRVNSRRPRNGREATFRDALLRTQPHIYVQQGLYRRRALEALGGFDEALQYQDVDLHLRLLRRYRMLWAGTPVFRYRILASSMSSFFHRDVEAIRSRFAAFAKHRDSATWKSLGPDAQRMVDASSWRSIARYAFQAGDAGQLRHAAWQSLLRNPAQPDLVFRASLGLLGNRLLGGVIAPLSRRVSWELGHIKLKRRAMDLACPDRVGWVTGYSEKSGKTGSSPRFTSPPEPPDTAP